MLRLCLKPPTWSLLPGLSLLQSTLHSTATMIYLKTASQDHFCFSGLHTDPTLPTKYHLSLQRGHRRHLSWSPPPSPGECPPTMPHHTGGSNNLPAVPLTSRLLPTDTHAPLSTLLSPPSRVSLPFFSWEWKHPQHMKGGTTPPGRKPSVSS